MLLTGLLWLLWGICACSNFVIGLASPFLFLEISACSFVRQLWLFDSASVASVISGGADDAATIGEGGGGGSSRMVGVGGSDGDGSVGKGGDSNGGDGDGDGGCGARGFDEGGGDKGGIEETVLGQFGADSWLGVGVGLQRGLVARA